MGTVENLSVRVREFAECVDETNASALAGLYDLTAQRLLRYSITITRNQHDSEDAVQAALVRVAEQPRLLSRSDQPWPYLIKMVRNESLLILRKKQRTKPIHGILDLLTRRSVDEVEVEDTYRAVWLALRKLPGEQSEVVVLKIWEGMTFCEIADVLDVSMGTVASRYRYALQKLSRRLAGIASEVHDG